MKKETRAALLSSRTSCENLQNFLNAFPKRGRKRIVAMVHVCPASLKEKGKVIIE
ncbi:MAG: hypothetical protein SV775_01345 [Thermodesulfobacteriota bacterium]|nr:hypothetical protein [Thermodesulfobacteriota bacterium]